MKANAAWMSSILPISAVSQGFGMIIPLYILYLHGTVFNVAIAAMLYNLVGIPASLFWGDLTDKLRKTKLFILLSILGIFPIILIIYFLAFVPVLEYSYGLFAFIATAASPSLNILIMSRKRNPKLPKYFSRYSVLSITGSLVGLIPGLFIDNGYIGSYLIFLLILNASALLLGWFFIEETAKKDTVSKKITLSIISFPILNMLSVMPQLLTGHRIIDSIHEKLKDHAQRRVYALLATIAIFAIGMSLFNTSYIPYLVHYGVSYYNVFSIQIANSIGQIMIYFLFIFFLSESQIHSYYRFSTLLRGTSYVLAFLPLLFFTSSFFYVNLLAYTVGGFAYALWNVASSVLIFSYIKKLKRGHYIGIWTAILGASAVVGSLMSGIISTYAGYLYTFIFGIIVTAFSYIIFNRVYARESAFT